MGHRLRALSWAAVFAVLGFTDRGWAEPIDWETLAHVPVIEVITEDEDGDVRETKVWFTLIGGDAYLRTSGSRWLANIRRNPVIALRIEGRTYTQRAEEAAGAEIIARVDAASREKYGVQERITSFFRMNESDILRLHPVDAVEDPRRPMEKP